MDLIKLKWVLCLKNIFWNRRYSEHHVRIAHVGFWRHQIDKEISIEEGLVFDEKILKPEALRKAIHKGLEHGVFIDAITATCWESRIFSTSFSSSGYKQEKSCKSKIRAQKIFLFCLKMHAWRFRQKVNERYRQRFMVLKNKRIKDCWLCRQRWLQVVSMEQNTSSIFRLFQCLELRIAACYGRSIYRHSWYRTLGVCSLYELD